MYDLNTKAIAKHFKREVPKGPRIICHYCGHKINANPRVGITRRRADHLQGCTEKPQEPDSTEVETDSTEDETQSVILSTGDYADIIKSTEEYDAEHDKLIIILLLILFM